jgi:hypothetical protein
MPSVFYRQAEIGGHCRPDRTIPQEVREISEPRKIHVATSRLLHRFSDDTIGRKIEIDGEFYRRRRLHSRLASRPGITPILGISVPVNIHCHKQAARSSSTSICRFFQQQASETNV